MTTKIAGIDYSITSPAVCTDRGVHAFGRQKWQGVHHGFYHIDQYPDHYTCEEQRHDELAQWTLAILMANAVEHVFLENYSYGSRGHTFHIGENMGHLKKTLWYHDIGFTLVAPGTLKNFATGNGRADKQAMVDAFVEQTGRPIRDDPFPTRAAKNIPEPITDIVDAYFLQRYGESKNV